MKNVWVLHKHGLIKRFADIFQYLPPTIVAQTMDMGNYRFGKKLRDPRTFSDLEVQKMATAFGMEWGALKRLIEPLEDLAERG